MAKLTLELDDSKTWIVLEAIMMMTSPIGETLLRGKFPNMDWNRLEKELVELTDQINEKLPKDANDGTQR